MQLIALIAAAAVAAFLALAGGGAAAQDKELLMPKGASEQDYRRALEQTRGLTRGIRPGTAEAPKPKLTGQKTPVAAAVESAPGVNANILFAYNSADLTDEARAELDKLGAALSATDAKGDRWRIEGHTDAAGGEDYNQRLSERRAQVVLDYLTQRFGLDPSRLEAVGVGETEPYDRSDPYAGVNRRVRLTYLGS